MCPSTAPSASQPFNNATIKSGKRRSENDLTVPELLSLSVIKRASSKSYHRKQSASLQVNTIEFERNCKVGTYLDIKIRQMK
jgi:hypothetical protein